MTKKWLLKKTKLSDNSKFFVNTHDNMLSFNFTRLITPLGFSNFFLNLLWKKSLNNDGEELYTNIHHSPQTIEHMKGQDIWHWKSKICPDLLSLNKTTHYHKNDRRVKLKESIFSCVFTKNEDFGNYTSQPVFALTP
jgi:hypothetical protein